jgi:hypothetical protein
VKYNLESNREEVVIRHVLFEVHTDICLAGLRIYRLG